MAKAITYFKDGSYYLTVDHTRLEPVQPYEQMKLKIGIIINGKVEFFKLCERCPPVHVTPEP